MFAPATEQLVYELEVTDLPASLDFYRAIGFEVKRTEAGFAELTWEGHLLFLAVSMAPETTVVRGNLRILVPDVDTRFQLIEQLGAPVVMPLRDAEYGLRDFTFCDPDGNQLRFATPLPTNRRMAS